MWLFTPLVQNPAQDSPTMFAAAQTTTLPCADTERLSNQYTTLPDEVTEASEAQETPDMPDHLGTAEPSAEGIIPANPWAGSHTTASQVIASPAALPTAPNIVCPPTGLTDLIVNIPLPIP